MVANLGHIRHPGLFRHLHVGLAIARVVDSQRQLTTILAGVALLANLHADAGKMRNPICTSGLAHIHQIIMDLAPYGDC